MADERPHPHRISVGFHGGQVLALRLTDKGLDSLNKALERGGWHEAHSEDGVIRLNLGEVVYVRVESDEHRVGFGA
ncbi:MAG TPA: hypothetical protein VGY97_00320 [Solirubrobacteraceae bacterium]|jgi:hypothetical protein|nr:hypothetical protein [Solirubrobacteraceae bacterium]